MDLEGSRRDETRVGFLVRTFSILKDTSILSSSLEVGPPLFGTRLVSQGTRVSGKDLFLRVEGPVGVGVDILETCVDCHRGVPG